ncbi:hypothetical protein CN160_18170 [Sinorhizobium meliloti]|nr:hypothetical protein CN160_18170 [Sinorhizobium meliloti]
MGSSYDAVVRPEIAIEIVNQARDRPRPRLRARGQGSSVAPELLKRDWRPAIDVVAQISAIRCRFLRAAVVNSRSGCEAAERQLRIHFATYTGGTAKSCLGSKAAAVFDKLCSCCLETDPYP